MRLKFVAVAAFLLTAGIGSAQNPSPTSLQINKDNRTLTVSASDHAEADADVADLNVGFVAYGQTLSAAYKSASDTSNAIVKAMIDAGATRTEIQSRSQRVSRLSDAETKTRRGMQFRVVQSWTVSTEPKTAALILDAAVQAGANQSGDIDWRMKDSVALDAEAVRRATERAQAIGAAMAKGMGAMLGKPLYATNSVNNVRISSGVMMNAYSMTDKSREVAPAPLDVEARRVEKTATVEIIYAIE
jgi:uncharacterized protein YggE